MTQFQMRTLTIISHTEHYKLPNGTIVGLGSTVTELNHLLNIFDQIFHVAMLHTTDAPASALPYESERIKLIPIKAVGGKSFIDKFSVLWQAPKVLSIVRKALNQSDYFQFRAPTGIGVYVIPYLMFLSTKKGWFKYAGNWEQKKAPFAYKFQKWLLEKQSRPVTINGFWEDQPKQCLSFENPCLTQKDVEIGQSLKANKVFDYPLQLCFVGRLEVAKGLDSLIEAVANLDDEDRLKIDHIHLVGDGQQVATYKNKVKDLNLPFVFHGFLSRDKVHEIYKKSHAIVLPSASEGFPKVIAEAMNYGCIPIVSNVSSIGHYIIHGKNGFLINSIDAFGVNEVLHKFLNLSKTDFSNLMLLNADELYKFSFSYYNNRIKTEIL